MIEVLWKTKTGVFNLCLTAAIQFHNILHVFRTGRGTRTASLEANLIQQLMEMRYELLYKIFLDLHKSYDTLYHDRYLNILAANGVGPWSLRLLWCYYFSKAMAAQISRLKNPHTSLHTYAKNVPEATRKKIYTAVNGQ